jgi:hypothetical protein
MKMTTVARLIEGDLSLPHQIIISGGRSAGEMAVSCNCRKFRRSSVGSYGFSPMAHVPYGDGSELEALRIYNKLSNHWPVDGEPDFHPESNNYKQVKHVEVDE